MIRHVGEPKMNQDSHIKIYNYHNRLISLSGKNKTPVFQHYKFILWLLDVERGGQVAGDF